MRRAGPRVGSRTPFERWVLVAGLVIVAGCGKSEPKSQALTFENLPDTAGLTRGGPILESMEPYRMANGAMRVRGHVNLPDGTRLRIAIRRPGERTTVASGETAVAGGAFDTPPLLGEGGPLPIARYRFEVRATFTADWQPAEVLDATHAGASLRGPGITRARDGSAVFTLEREERK